MSSGVTLHEDCLEAYQKLKLKSPTKALTTTEDLTATKDPKTTKDLKATKEGAERYKYIIFNLSKDNTQIIVEKKALEVKSEKDEVSADGEIYEDFLQALPENECRWGVYDLVYEKEGGKRKKIIFVTWAPDTAKIKQKMLFASSTKALTESLTGLPLMVQATDLSEVSYETVLEKINRR